MDGLGFERHNFTEQSGAMLTAEWIDGRSPKINQTTSSDVCDANAAYRSGDRLMLFACICSDKPHMGELREKVFPSHLKYMKSQADKIKDGGPFVDEDSGMVGTLLIIDVDGHQAAREFMENEEFNKAGLFETVKIRRYRQYQPEVASGDSELAQDAAKLQLRQDGIEPSRGG